MTHDTGIDNPESGSDIAFTDAQWQTICANLRADLDNRLAAGNAFISESEVMGHANALIG